MPNSEGVIESKTARWLAPVRAGLADADESRGLIVRFPTYRPDLVAAMARSLGFVLVDFRQSRMAPLGRQAASLPLGALAEALIDAMERGPGVVLHNAEALLGLHDSGRRAAWFARVAAPGWAKPFIVPVTLFGDDAPANSARVLTLDSDLLPAETLLSRLAGLR